MGYGLCSIRRLRRWRAFKPLPLNVEAKLGLGLVRLVSTYSDYLQVDVWWDAIAKQGGTPYDSPFQYLRSLRIFEVAPRRKDHNPRGLIPTVPETVQRLYFNPRRLCFCYTQVHHECPTSSLHFPSQYLRPCHFAVKLFKPCVRQMIIEANHREVVQEYFEHISDRERHEKLNIKVIVRDPAIAPEHKPQIVRAWAKIFPVPIEFLAGNWWDLR